MLIFDTDFFPSWAAQAVRTPENYAADLARVARLKARLHYQATHSLQDQLADLDRAAARAKAVRK